MNVKVGHYYSYMSGAKYVYIKRIVNNIVLVDVYKPNMVFIHTLELNLNFLYSDSFKEIRGYNTKLYKVINGE